MCQQKNIISTPKAKTPKALPGRGVYADNKGGTANRPCLKELMNTIHAK